MGQFPDFRKKRKVVVIALLEKLFGISVVRKFSESERKFG